MKFVRNLISFAHAALSCRNFASQREFRVQIKMFIALSGVRTVAHERAEDFYFVIRDTPTAPLRLSRHPAHLATISLFYEPDSTPVMSNVAIMPRDCHFRSSLKAMLHLAATQ